MTTRRRQPERAEQRAIVEVLNVFVPGDPKGQPRPRAFSSHGHARVYDPGTAEGWKGEIARAVGLVASPYLGPCSVDLVFVFARPKHHYRKNGSVRETAPFWHASKPDIDNVVKAVLDALTQLGVWRDDSQVVTLRVQKRFAAPGLRSGCLICAQPAHVEDQKCLS